MRITCHRYRTLEYAITAPFPGIVAPSEVGVRRVFFDCLLVSVGVEDGDTRWSDMAARAIRQIATNTAAAFIVVDGAPRQANSATANRGLAGSDPLSQLADTLDVMTDIADRLEERGLRVHRVPLCRKRWRTDPSDTGIQHEIRFPSDSGTWTTPSRRSADIELPTTGTVRGDDRPRPSDMSEWQAALLLMLSTFAPRRITAPGAARAARTATESIMRGDNSPRSPWPSRCRHVDHGEYEDRPAAPDSRTSENRPTSDVNPDERVHNPKRAICGSSIRLPMTPHRHPHRKRGAAGER